MVRCVDDSTIHKWCGLFDCLWQSMHVYVVCVFAPGSLAQRLSELQWSVVTPSSVSQIRLPSAPAPKERRFENIRKPRKPDETSPSLEDVWDTDTSHFRDLPSKAVSKWHWQVLRWGLMLPRKAKPGKATEIVHQLRAEQPKKRTQRVSTKVGFCPDPLWTNHIIPKILCSYCMDSWTLKTKSWLISWMNPTTVCVVSTLTLYLLAFGHCITLYSHVGWQMLTGFSPFPNKTKWNGLEWKGKEGTTEGEATGSQSLTVEPTNAQVKPLPYVHTAPHTMSHKIDIGLGPFGLIITPFVTCTAQLDSTFS